MVVVDERSSEFARQFALKSLGPASLGRKEFWVPAGGIGGSHLQDQLTNLGTDAGLSSPVTACDFGRSPLCQRRSGVENLPNVGE